MHTSLPGGNEGERRKVKIFKKELEFDEKILNRKPFRQRKDVR
jgi:hypothetical protein